MKLLANLRRLWADRRGVAIVELAVIAPVVAGLAVISFEVWMSAQRIEDTRGALSAAANYYMTGGSNDTKARTIAMSAWEQAPSGSAVSVARVCSCNEVVQACSVLLCADSSQPKVVVTIQATGTYGDGLFNRAVSEQRMIRVR